MADTGTPLPPSSPTPGAAGNPGALDPQNANRWREYKVYLKAILPPAVALAIVFNYAFHQWETGFILGVCIGFVFTRQEKS